LATRGQLSDAFNLVANHENWKNPIDTVIDLSDQEMAMVREASHVAVIAAFEPRLSPHSHTQSSGREGFGLGNPVFSA
jgi:hypothetical protein